MEVSHRNSGTHSWHVLQFNHFFFRLPELDQVARTEERSKFDGFLGLQSYLWKGGIKGPLNPCPFHRLSEVSGGALRAKNRHNEKHRVIQAVTFKRGPVSEWRPDLFTQRLETSNDEVKGHSLNHQVYIPNALCMVYLLHLPYKIAKCRWIHQTLSIMGMFLQVASIRLDSNCTWKTLIQDTGWIDIGLIFLGKHTALPGKKNGWKPPKKH